jgi:quercetin dioxygenase-like cupin family protein
MRRHAPTEVESEPVLIPAEEVKFTEVLPGVEKALLWGDKEKGPYGAYTKFKAGHVNPLHSHGCDLRIAVIKGAYLYTGEDGREVRLGPGSYGMIPAGYEHVSAGHPTEETLFFEIGSDTFTLDVAKR